MTVELSFDKEDSMRGFSFMDQCRVICLSYMSEYEEVVEGIPKDSENYADSLSEIAAKELSAFPQNEEYNEMIQCASKLLQKSKTMHIEEEAIASGVRNLQNSLNQKSFNESLMQLIGTSVQTWEQVTKVFHFVYNACKLIGTARLGDIIDFCVRYLHIHAELFIEQEGGWKTDYVDISSSIVMVSKSQHEELQKEAKAYEQEKFETSPPDTPPYTVVSRPVTDDERDSLSTPPEIIEKPHVMTESLMKMVENPLLYSKSDDANMGSNGENSDSLSKQAKNLDDKKQETVDNNFKPSSCSDNSFFWNNLPVLSVLTLAVSLGIAYYIVKRKV